MEEKYCLTFECYEHRKYAIGKNGYCLNCNRKNNSTDNLIHCMICRKLKPTEGHHIIPQSLRYKHRYSDKTIPICLNCHACITRLMMNRVLFERKNCINTSTEQRAISALIDVINVLETVHGELYKHENQ